MAGHRRERSQPAKGPGAEFVAAAGRPEEFPALGLREIAVVGRSNVGKSSFLNALCGARGLARVSNTPGRTRSVNFFRWAGVALVDLPGYGWAKVSKEERNRWKNVVESYLDRTELRLVILLVDSRIAPTPLDRTMLAWLEQRALATLVVATKVDKLPRSRAKATAAAVAASLQVAPTSVRAVSAVTGEGVKEVRALIAAMVTATATGAAGASTVRTAK